MSAVTSADDCLWKHATPPPRGHPSSYLRVLVITHSSILDEEPVPEVVPAALTSPLRNEFRL